jgi:diguanylate cyclase (GGDEF)-like protein/PAS domain S-box-containing protein
MNAVLDNGKKDTLTATVRNREGIASLTKEASSGLSILMVEDEKEVCDVVSFRLKQNGFLVTFAHNGEQALELVGKTHFDLVLLDIGLPGISGVEVLKILRRHYSSAELPVIMLSGKASSGEIVESLDLGANDFVPKPIDFPVALARIRTQVSRIQAEMALHESEERFALAACAANDGLWDWNLKTNTAYYSPRWKNMLGYEESDIGNLPEEWFDRVHPEDIARVKADITAHLNGETSQYENEHRMLHKNGTYRWMLSRGMMIRVAGGKVSRMSGSLTDITEAKVSDALTGLPNRILFLDRLGRTFERAKYVDGYRYAVLFLDLDRFKVINDSLGHLMGDQLIVETARRLKGCLHTADTVARLGGDEFTILLEDIKQIDDVTKVADRIEKELTVPFILGGQEVFMTTSIGIALSDRSYERPEDLLRDADIAMYRAKASGKARCELFDAEMRNQAVARLQFENDLRRALLRREFQVYYQPIVLLETGRIVGFEALTRWNHPTRGLISPAEFVPVAEETGLIIPICRWVLQEACRQTKIWQEKYPSIPPLMICVNFSWKQLMQPDLVKQIKQVLAETGLTPSSLKLELSESLIADHARSPNNILQQLNELGIRVVIDDFGTNSSSLFSLHRLSIDTLKINRSFVNSIGIDPETLLLVRTIVRLTRDLGVNVIAVGVENNKQLTELKIIGCEFGQGYYFSSPVDAPSATDLILRQIG